MSAAVELEIEPVVYAFQTEHGGWRVTGSRVSLDSIIHAFSRGQTPEQIVQSFPTLTLEQVHGAIAFYLRHQQMLDAYMQRQAERLEQLRREAEERNRDLRARIRQRAGNLETGEPAE